MAVYAVFFMEGDYPNRKPRFIHKSPRVISGGDVVGCKSIDKIDRRWVIYRQKEAGSDIEEMEDDIQIHLSYDEVQRLFFYVWDWFSRHATRPIKRDGPMGLCYSLWERAYDSSIPISQQPAKPVKG